MSTDVAVPEGLWDADQEGVIGTWYYESGEQVSQGQVIAEVLTEKVAHDIVAPADGVLEILVAEEQPVRPLTPIARVV
ncbi:MAG: lipoyl domain-containing protein [Pseudomonadota bacterium]